MDDWLIIKEIEDVVAGTSIPYNYERSKLSYQKGLRFSSILPKNGALLNIPHCGMACLQLPADGSLTAGDEAAVDAVLLHQRIVGAALDDLPPVHHKDLVGAADGF